MLRRLVERDAVMSSEDRYKTVEREETPAARDRRVGRELSELCARLAATQRNMPVPLSEAERAGLRAASRRLQRSTGPAEAALLDVAEYLWTVVANVSEGNWYRQTPTWREAAKNARDQFHEVLQRFMPSRSTPAMSLINSLPPHRSLEQQLEANLRADYYAEAQRLAKRPTPADQAVDQAVDQAERRAVLDAIATLQKHVAELKVDMRALRGDLRKT